MFAWFMDEIEMKIDRLFLILIVHFVFLYLLQQTNKKNKMSREKGYYHIFSKVIGSRKIGGRNHLYNIMRLTGYFLEINWINI